MADPKSKSPIYNKGLVVGAVQSGKTGNFNAVINRAIDAGYEIVIVLAGIMEDLRSQTQLLGSLHKNRQIKFIRSIYSYRLL